MNTPANREMDQLLRKAAAAHNGALPLQDWKERILAQTEPAAEEIPAENILSFARPARKPFYQKALPYACAAAALVVFFAGIGTMGGFEKFMAPAAQEAPAAAAGADMAVMEAAPAEAAMTADIAESQETRAYDGEDFENGVFEAAEEEAAPAADAPAAEAPAMDLPVEAPAAESDTGSMSYSALSRSMPDVLALSGDNSVPLMPVPEGAALSELAETVAWLALDSGEDVVPFRIQARGELCHGHYGVYDGDTLEPLEYFLPSGLEPETYLFRNAAPGGRCLVTVELDGVLYAFGVLL